MTRKNKIRILVTFLLLLALPCAAQDFRGWHLRSSIGFDWSGDSFSPITLGTPQTSSPNSSIGGEAGADLSGIVLDPKFITFETNFDFQHGATSVNAGDYSNGVLSGGVNVELLPISRYPLEVFYQKSGADTSGSFFGSNSDNSQFRVRWTLNLRHLPRIVVSRLSESNDVQLVTSLSNTSYKQSEYTVQANDRTAGWVWSAGANFGNFDEKALGQLSLGAGVKEDYRTFNARAFRQIWSGKGVLSSNFSDEHYTFDFRGAGNTVNDNLLYSTDLQVQHTQKLSSHYIASFSHQNQTGDLISTTGGVTLLNIPSLNTESLGAGLNYQLAAPVILFQEVEYQHLTPITPLLEAETSLMQSSSGVNVIKRWKVFDFSGTYTGRFQTLTTTLDNRGNSWSNNVDSRVGWGNAKRVRLTGSYRYDQLNLVQQIGGFSKFNTLGVQAETAALWDVRIVGGVDHGKINILNSSGQNARTYTNYQFEMEHRIFHIMANHGLDDGSGSIFPSALAGQFFISVPLPVEQLIATPLLNRNSQTTNLTALLRPKRGLEIGAYFRKENDVLAGSEQNYRLWEIRGHYNIGRVSIDAGFGNIRTLIDQTNTVSGLGINRYWFRIRRTFNFF